MLGRREASWMAVGATVAVIFSLLTVQPGEAQTIDCVESLSGGIYQIYLDELDYTKEGLQKDPQLQNLMQRLYFKLRTNAKGLTLSSTPVPLALAFCKGRKPKGEASFNKRMVESLDDRDVILELWGLLDGKQLDDQVSNRNASICFVLVPVLLDEYQNPFQPGLQFVTYPKAPDVASGELINLLEQSLELETFAAIGIGVNLLKNRKYDEAMKYICKARILLQPMVESGEKESRKALMDYVEETARQIIVKARGDANYTGALIELVDPDNPCP